MKKMCFEKPLAIVLAALMFFSSLPAAAWAAEAEDKPAADSSSAVSDSSSGPSSKASESSADSSSAVSSSSAGSSAKSSESSANSSSGTAGGSSDSSSESTAAPTVKVTAQVVEAESGEKVSAKGYSYDAGDTAVTLKANVASNVEGGSWGYQWWALDDDGCGSGVSNAAVYTPATDRAGKENYRCDVTYTLNGKKYKAETDEVPVQVFAASAEKPTIYENPDDAVYQSGTLHLLPLEVDAWCYDGGTLSYQWYVSTDGQTYSKAEGATSKSYTPKTSEKAAVYFYYCEVTNTQPSRLGKPYTSSVKTKCAKVTFESVPENVWQGKGTADSPFLLSSAEDLNHLKDYVNTKGFSFDGCFFKMTKDLSLPDGWAPIGALKDGQTADTDGGASAQYGATGRGKNIRPFSGTFDGGNHTLTVPKGGLPLLGYVRYATVKNLKIYGPQIAGYGLVNHYCVDYGPTGNYGDYTSGASYPDMPLTVEINHVTLVTGTKTLKSGMIGGYASGANTVRILNSTVEKGVTIGYDGRQSNIGSFAGWFNGTIENCVSSADVCGENNVGGLVGAKGQSMGNCSVLDSAFHGAVKTSGTYAGGLIGSGYADGSYSYGSAPNTPCVTVQNCYADGSVTGKDYVGGLLGGEPSCKECWANGTGYIQNNYFSGKVAASDTSGEAETKQDSSNGLLKIFRAFSSGLKTLTGLSSNSGDGKHVGGIVGGMRSLDRYNVISNNYYLNTSAKAGIGAVNSVEQASRQEQSLSRSASANFTVLGVGRMLSRWGSSLNPERYGRSDDPTGNGAVRLTTPVTAEQLKGGPVLARLNSGANSSGIWVKGKNGCPALNPGEKHMVSFAVTDYEPQRCRGGFQLKTISAVAAYSDGSTKQVSKAQMRVSGFDSSKEGYDTVTASYKNHNSLFEVEVTSNEDKSADSQITVSFRLIGATKSSGPISLKDGDYKGSEYVTWIPTESCTLSAGSTVADLFRQELGKAGLTSVISGGKYGYVSSVYAPKVCGGYKLSENTNGKRSGWMFTVNGKHPGDSMSDVKLEDGDKVVWHYVDDYSYEVADWFSEPSYPGFGSGDYYNAWLQALDEAPTAKRRSKDQKQPEDEKDSDSGKTDQSRANASRTSGSKTFTSDTTSDFSVHGSYLFKITSKDGKVPAFVIGTPGVFETQLVKTAGGNYYFRIKPTGSVGASAGVYVDGVKIVTVTVGSTAPPVRSDTAGTFCVGAGKSYVFRLTSDAKPVFLAGTSSAFRVDFIGARGKDYFFRVTATGKSGAGCGFYLNHEKKPVAVATVA